MHPASDSAPWWRRHAALLAILAIHAAVWGALNLLISPHPDTIDHWVQSRIWSLGYVEHPPMVEWMLRGFTALFGATEAGLEISAQIVNLGVLALAYSVAAWHFGRLAGLFTVLFMESAPYFSAGSVMFQIEQPLMLAWLAALGCLLQYQRTRRGRWLVLMGVCAGLGGLSKYTMVLFYLGGAAYLASVSAARREWRNPYLYLGGLAALLVVSPVIWWNYQHDWISFRYQWGKGGAENPPFGAATLSFTAGWFVLFSAVAIVWGVRAAWGRLRAEGLRDSPLTLLWIVSLTPIVFFTLVLLRGSFADPKWANVGFLGLFMILGKVCADLWQAGARRGVLRAAITAHALNTALIAAVIGQIAFGVVPIEPERDPTRRFTGHREAAEAVERLLREQGRRTPEYVVAISYRVSSTLVLYMQGQPLPYSLERPARNLWADSAAMTPDNTVFVCSGDCRRLPYSALEGLGIVVEPLGRTRPARFGRPLAETGVFVMAEGAVPSPM